jgi:adhesin/invasin
MTLRTILPVLAAAGLAACDGPGAPELPAVAAVQALSGDGQEGTAGAALEQPLLVRVVDSRGRPVEGRIVTFAVTSGAGQVTPGSVTTSPEGRAQARWVLGTSTGEAQRAEARVEGSAGTVLTAAFTATPKPGPAAAVAAVGETSFTGITGAALPTPLRVRVTDALGNPVPGVNVSWNAQWGGGALPFTTQTDAAGEATAAWSLGTLADEPQRAVARAAGASATFTAVAAPPADVVVTTQGSGQSTEAGTGFRDFLWLRVRLPDGRGVWGAQVEWSGDRLLIPTSRTDGAGNAHNAWTATALGPQTARATLRTAAGPLTVEWTGTGTPRLPLALRAADELPREQAAGRPAQPGVRAQVTDANGFAVPGVTVRWGVAEGGGSVSADSSVTDAQGFAATDWTLGPPGAQELRAWLDADPFDWLTYLATSVAGPP